MKKVIIFGYFLSMVVVTYFTIQLATYIGDDDVVVAHHENVTHLSDTEVERRKIQHKSGHHVHEKIETKHTYTKSNLGWNVKVDTIGVVTFYIERD